MLDHIQFCDQYVKNETEFVNFLENIKQGLLEGLTINQIIENEVKLVCINSF